jgi:SAM-dependent methyltransferase
MLISSTNDPQQHQHWEEDTRYRSCEHPVPVRFADQRIRYIRSWFDLSQIETALDVGCGNGLSMFRLREHIPRIFGVDRSGNMLSHHPFRATSRLALADGARLPFRDNAFDLVFGWEVLHHIAEPEQAVAEAVRVSRRWILFAEPNRYNPCQFAYALYDREHRWVLRYSLAFMRNLLIGAGVGVRHASRAGWIFPNITPMAIAPLLEKLPFQAPFAISNWVLGEKTTNASAGCGVQT